MVDPNAREPGSDSEYDSESHDEPAEHARAPPADTRERASSTAPSLEQRALPDLATRIREAQRQARERRVEAGLPADPDDGGYTPRKPKKHAPKRGKKHGQFLGTVADSWEATRRRS